MKLYNSIGPNPKAVRMFAAELGTELELHEIDLMAAENRQEDFLRLNPAGQLPALELENGEMRFPIHPITHRAGLFQHISKFDPEYSCFKDDDGEWLFYASDAVLARPLFYLAGAAKTHYCNRVLYLYTEGHESSVFVSNNKEQIETCRIITNRPRLPMIESYSG